MRNLIGDRPQFHARMTSKSPEEDRQPPGNFGQIDCSTLMGQRRIEAAGKIMPQLPDRFLGFPWLKVDLDRQCASPHHGGDEIKKPAFDVLVVGKRFDHCRPDCTIHIHSLRDQGCRIDNKAGGYTLLDILPLEAA